LILVVCGTQKHNFSRLINYSIKMLRFDENIVVQAGWTEYKDDRLNIHQFLPYRELDKLYDEADIILTHGGTASIISGLEKNKSVIIVPRLKKFNEHIDDHQLEISKKLYELGYVEIIHDEHMIGEVFKKAKNKTRKTFNLETNIKDILNSIINGDK
jgi:UDP-N-acetylglucosamine transferase subunit ALG13